MLGTVDRKSYVLVRLIPTFPWYEPKQGLKCGYCPWLPRVLIG